MISLVPVRRLTSLLVRLRSVLSLVLAVALMKAWLKGHSQLNNYFKNIPYTQSSVKLPVTWSLGHLVTRSLGHSVT